MHLADAVATALDALRANRVRSFLTLLGVVIGVSIVILLTSMGESAQAYVAQTVQSVGFGANALVVHPGNFDPPVAASRLTYDDAQEITRRVPGVRDVVPVIVGTLRARAGGRSYLTSVTGVTANYPTLVSFHPREGTFFSDADVRRRRSVCVIGHKVREALYAGFSPVGETLRLGNRKLLCLGVMEQKGESVGFDLDKVVYVPVTTGEDLFGTSRLLEMIVWAYTPEQVRDVRQGISDMLLSRHKRADDFHFHTQDEVMSVLGKITGALTTFVAAIAAISLVVGSIGIMNIMLVSVAERTREIGVRKALGARRRDIFVQFFIEALVVSMIGGLGGIVVGSGLCVVILSLINLPVRVTLWAVLAAVAASAAVGVVSGVYPAVRAAELDPVQALRYE